MKLKHNFHDFRSHRHLGYLVTLQELKIAKRVPPENLKMNYINYKLESKKYSKNPCSTKKTLKYVSTYFSIEICLEITILLLLYNKNCYIVSFENVYRKLQALWRQKLMDWVKKHKDLPKICNRKLRNTPEKHKHKHLATWPLQTTIDWSTGISWKPFRIILYLSAPYLKVLMYSEALALWV